MAKIYFKHGAMKSGKSMECLRAIYNYTENEKVALVAKPKLDTRSSNIKSRQSGDNGVECLELKEEDARLIALRSEVVGKVDVIIIDEAQFLNSKQVESLRYFAYELDIPVICYGLSVDYASHLFEGSKRLFELADDIQELIGICSCGKRAKQNARKDSTGAFVKDGAPIQVGDKEYVPLCNKCYYFKVEKK